MPERPVILVVDDDAPILLLMRNLLREFGFTPVAAASGAEAIRVATQEPPDLILLDRNMPGMSGDEVLKVLRGHDRLKATPVLILSGEPMERNELDAMGATGAVLKPFDVTALVGTIRSYLS